MLKGAVAWPVAALSCLLVIDNAPQQERLQPIPRFRSGVDVVTLDVSVLDGDRRPVRGLTAADFTVLEDGKPQRILAFTAVDLPDVTVPSETAGSWLREIASDVQRNVDVQDHNLVVLVLDDATPMPAADVLRARTYAHRVVDHLGPRDLCAIVFPLNKAAGQDFTSDRARLITAIDRFNGSVDGVLGLDKDGAPKVVFFDDFQTSAATLYAATLRTLQALAENLAQLPDRRKAVVLISVGIPLEIAEAGPVEALGVDVADSQGVARQVITDLTETVQAAARANVNIYAFDPGGLRAPNERIVRYGSLGSDPTRDVNPGRLNRDFLRGLAAATGGLAFTDTNDPQPGITQVFRENASYYLLGYEPSDGRHEGRYRKTEVRVNRPKVTVRARDGYYEPRRDDSNPTHLRTHAEGNPAAGILPKCDLFMQVAAAPFAIAGKAKSAVAVVVGLRAPAVVTTLGILDRVEVAIKAYGPDGKQRASTEVATQATLYAPKDPSEIRFEVMSRIDLPPGRYQLRVGAVSLHRAAGNEPSAADSTATKVSGSAYCDVDVPDFDSTRLSLSRIALSSTPPVLSAPKSRLAGLVPVVPTSKREFALTDRVEAFIRIYQGRDAQTPEDVRLEWHLVDAQGATVSHTSETVRSERFVPTRGADYRVQLPICNLHPGPYLLTMEAEAGSRKARRDLRFDVRH